MAMLWTLPCFAGASGALLLALTLIWKKKSREGYVLRAFTSVLVAIAWINLASGLAISNEEQALFWRQVSLIGELALPIAIYHVCLSLTEQLSDSVDLSRLWRLRAMILIACGLGILVVGFPHLIMISVPGSTEIVFQRPEGRLIWAFILITLVVGLSELERILRASRDPLRYQLKFIVIGLGGLAGFEIVQSSQLLLFSLWPKDYAWVRGVVTLICVGLIAFGFGRWRIQDLGQRIYLSHQVLYTSLTFLLVGFYLIGVGVLAEVIQQTNWALSEALGMLLLFVGCVALVIVLFSRQVRAEIQVFISRHFYRSKYDYRLQWLQLTEAMSASHSIDTILDQYLAILSRTFGAAKITIWLEFEADRRFHQVRTVNIEPPPEPISASHPIVMALKNEGEPIHVSERSDETSTELHTFQQTTQSVVCVPLQVPLGPLMGFATLSHELQGRTYGKDDFDLLRAMAHHVTMLLTKVRLMEERSAAAEWEALHRFSAFYIHDLKNLASGLSLVAQNAEVYGHDQEFQSSAMRTIGHTAQRMMGLIGKLSTQLSESAPASTERVSATDINVLIQDTINSLNGAGCKPKFITSSDLLFVQVHPESFKQVLLNLILNARQAMGEQGTIEVRTEQEEEMARISVRDEGPGIPPAQLRNLFQPFRTTKKGGLGVGLYQCKQIVEQHKGSIQVDSREGQGTQVSITLPLVSQ